MRCKKVNSLLNHYADGECVDPVEVLGIEEHLAECTACRMRLDEIRALRRILLRAEKIETVPVPTDEIMRRYRASTRPSLPVAASRWRLPFDPVPFAAVAAAVILLAGSIGMLGGDGDASIGQYLLQGMSPTEFAYLTAGEGAYTLEYYVK